ncbi:MAG: type II secretion system protein GspN [Thermodesulfobacteriota bacterium]
MAATPKKLAGAVFVFMLLLVAFVLLRFPFAAVGRRLAVEVARASGGALALDAGRGRWRLEPAIVFEGGRLRAMGGSVAIDGLRLLPAPAFLLGRGPAGSCRMALLGGELAVSLRRSSAGAAVTVAATDLAIDDLPVRFSFGTAKLSGTLSGRLRGEPDGDGHFAGDGELRLRDGRVRVQGVPAEVADLSFTELVAPLRLSGGRLTSEALVWRGRETEGKAQGWISLDGSRFRDGAVSVGGTFRILPELYGRLQKEGLPVELLAGGADAAVPFRISGTIDHWKLTLHEE